MPDEQCTPNQLTRADYAAIDRERVTETGRDTDMAPSRFFPLAFATSKETPLHFNFDLCLLDTLALPCPIMPEGQEDGPVTFQSRWEAIEYCRGAMERWKKENCTSLGDSQPSQSHPRKSHEEIDKESLFRSEGRSLERLMESGEGEFDANLHWVREDR